MLRKQLVASKLLRQITPLIVGETYIHRWVAPTLKWLSRRREEIGPEPPSHRSTYSNWNYTAELYAFGKRLNEHFRDDTLRAAFTHRSYLEHESRKRQELGMLEAPLNLKENTDLIEKGQEFLDRYVKNYLRASHPYLPEEGICAVHKFLTSDDILSHISSNIGTKDLILCEEVFPNHSTLAKTFKAIVGTLWQDSGEERARLFIQDFLLTQLIGRDVCDLWNITNPMGILIDILKRQGRAPPESRMLWKSGQNTIQAVYNVGIYSDQKMIGMAPGETVLIAEEMAARDALRRLFQLSGHKSPLPFGKKGRELVISESSTNPSISEWTTELASRRIAA